MLVYKHTFTFLPTRFDHNFFFLRVPRSKWALQRAKFIVEHEYSVVGILDKMNETLQVLERYVPRFFAGSSKIYYNRGLYKLKHQF